MRNAVLAVDEATCQDYRSALLKGMDAACVMLFERCLLGE